MNARPISTITADGAAAAVAAARAHAGSIGRAVVIIVTDPNGLPVATLRMDGAPLLSVDIAADKAWTVAAYGQPSDWWIDLFATDPDLRSLANNNRLMPVAGGVPIRVDGDLVGAIGVSGASGEEDKAIAQAGAAAVV